MSNARPLKEAELRELATCANCEKLLGQTHSPLFYRVTIEQHFINFPAIKRQQGLTSILGDSARLAAAMGPDEDMTKTMDPPNTVMICMPCACKGVTIAAIQEKEVHKKLAAPTPP